MKHGHVTGKKIEKPHASDWYRTIEAAHIARLEAQEQAKQALVATHTDLTQVLADVQAAQSALAAYTRAQQGGR